MDDLTVEQYDDRMEELGAQLAELQEQFKAVREARDEAVSARIAGWSDADIMGDEQRLRWVLQESFYHSDASKRVHVMYATGRKDVVAESVDGRDEVEGAVLPALQLRLSYRQPVGELAEAMRSWAATWALGRPNLVVGILEHTLSRWASYGLLWDLKTGRAALRSNGYRELKEGPLEELLAVIAEDYWLEGGPRSDHDDYS